MKKRILFSVLLLLFTFFLMTQGGKMVIKSPDFKEGELIPKMFSCEGEDYSPKLEWENAPEATKSFALICDDPDALMGTWVHWVIYNIPKEFKSLERNIPKKPKLENGILQGKNSWPKTGYNGPCPPPGKPHRYFFKLYALDTVLSLKENATKEDLLSAMKGHILAETQTMGTYKR
ncbi:MAG: YbhB/YbcL family Raf kinase inhibitor-like protein [Thermoanaerobaculaceae bacterium]|nr:YbhB/YbcL family Raf kinase inhibitor-like protein [Thermoanaerobaculaceae bacterium]